MRNQRMAQLRARRGQASRSAAREITIPLPLRGMFSLAKTAGVSGLYASELLNLRSNGVSMVLRPALTWCDRQPSNVLQRVAFDFDGRSDFIEISAGQVRCAGASMARTFSGRAMAATNSGNVLIADGMGLPVRYDGTSFHVTGFTAESGPNPAECDGIISHHDRIYLWKTGGDLDFLVGDVGAVTGAMTSFPFGRLGNVKGSIQSMVSLTVDAGNGMNDVLCIITTAGQMVIYEGYDPTDPQDWRVAGRVNGAAPIGPRAFTQVGSDAWMLTAQGPISIGQALRESVLALSSDVAKPVANEIAELVEAGPADWQMFTAHDGSMVVINRVKDGTALQYVFYLDSKSWATMDMPVRDWHNMNGSPFVTAIDGRLGSLRHTGSDEFITARWTSSWFDAGSDLALTYIKPTIIADGPLTVRLVTLSDRNATTADIAASEQTITVEPEQGGEARVTLSEVIPTAISGSTFQITLEVTARWMEITTMRAALGS